MDDGASLNPAPTHAEMVSRAAALNPSWRGRAAAAELARRAPSETIADIVELGVHRICQPKRFGGYEMDWTTLCETVMELAKGDGAQAWVANVYGEHSCVASLFPDEAQHDVWDDNPDALISSSYAPVGTAEAVSNGYRLNGRWGFSSGIHHTNWSIVGALTPSTESGEPHLSLFLVPAADRTIIDDWQVVGMAGTGSCSFDLDDVFVPSHRVLDERLVWQGDAPGASVNHGHVYRMPQRGVAQLALASVPVGAALGAAEDFEERLRTGQSMGRPLAELPTLQVRLADASASAEAARRMILGTIEPIMTKLKSGGRADNDDIAQAMRDGAYACNLARRAVDTIFEAAGGNGTRLDNHLQRTLRDVHAASNHIALGWDFAATLYGRVKLGLERPI